LKKQTRPRILPAPQATRIGRSCEQTKDDSIWLSFHRALAQHVHLNQLAASRPITLAGRNQMKAKKKTASKRLKKGKKLAATKALRTGTRFLNPQPLPP
jgi:hypothetical protein